MLLYCKFTLVFAAVRCCVMVPGAGIEPARSVQARDFKSLVSTYFTIRAAVRCC